MRRLVHDDAIGPGPADSIVIAGHEPLLAAAGLRRPRELVFALERDADRRQRHAPVTVSEPNGPATRSAQGPDAAAHGRERAEEGSVWRCVSNDSKGARVPFVKVGRENTADIAIHYRDHGADRPAVTAS